MQRANKPSKRSFGPWIIALVLVALLCISILWRLMPSYDWNAGEPLGYADLRLNGHPAPQGELLSGERGPRNLMLGMPLEEALKAMPVMTDALQPEDYTLLYGQEGADGSLPAPPYALITVVGGEMQLHIVTAPNEAGDYGQIVGVLDPEENTLSSLRWQSTRIPGALSGQGTDASESTGDI